MNQLEVGIGVSTDKLKKGLSEAEKALNNFAKETKTITNSLSKNAIETSKVRKQVLLLNTAYKAGKISENAYGRGLLDLTNKEKVLANQSKKLRNDLTKLNQSTRDLGNKGMGTLKKGAASGNSAMTAFSRTIQDAPFGIMGVSNNITNLTEQFGYLKNKTGSTGGALKAMLKDLKGFGGITLAISVVTSLLLVFGDTLFKTKDKAKELKEEQEKLTKALKDYEDQLDAVKKSRLIGGRAAASELAHLQLLSNQTIDTTRDIGHRKKALAELQKIYPSYFANLSTDIKDQRELGFAMIRLREKIEDHNRAKAAQGLISKNVRKITGLEIKAEEANLKLKKFTADQTRKSSKETIANNETLKEYNNLLNQINPLLEKNARLTQVVRNAGGVVPLDFSIKAVTTDNIKVSSDIELEDGAQIIGLDKISENLLKSTSKQGLLFQEGFKNQFKLEIPPVDTKELALLQLRLMEFNAAANELIQGSIANTFMGLGDAIGSALSEGGNVLMAVGSAILQGLGKFISEMGGMLIKYGTLAILKGKLDIAILAGGPIAIGAGIAAVAVGVALKAAGSAIGSFATSGSSGSEAAGGGSSSSSGFTSSRSSSGFSGSGDGTVVFEIAGNKLIGVLSNTLRQNRSLGGGLGLTT